jgi:hypothetical protein
MATWGYYTASQVRFSLCVDDGYGTLTGLSTVPTGRMVGTDQSSFEEQNVREHCGLQVTLGRLPRPLMSSERTLEVAASE